MDSEQLVLNNELRRTCNNPMLQYRDLEDLAALVQARTTQLRRKAQGLTQPYVGVVEPNKGRKRLHFISRDHYNQVYQSLSAVQAFLNDFFMTVDPDELWIEIQDPQALHKTWNI